MNYPNSNIPQFDEICDNFVEKRISSLENGTLCYSYIFNGYDRYQHYYNLYIKFLETTNKFFILRSDDKNYFKSDYKDPFFIRGHHIYNPPLQTGVVSSICDILICYNEDVETGGIAGSVNITIMIK